MTMTRKARGLAVAVAALAALLAVLWLRPQESPRVQSSATAGETRKRGGGFAGQVEGSAGAFVEGRVLGPKRAPLPGAAVVAIEVSAGRARGRAGVTATEGDAGGRFRLGPLPAGRYRVTAAAPGHLPGTRELAVAGEATASGVDFVLEAGGVVLSGRVLDAGVGAIAGGRVRAHLHGESADAAVAIARTDRAGGYRLTLPPGFHELVVDAGGYAPVWSRVWLVGDTTRDFRLIPAASISGRVVHAGTSTGVAEALVRTGRGQGSPEVQTDAEGAFVLPDLEPGDHHLFARAGALTGRAAMPVTTRLGTRVEGVLIEVKAGRSLSGQVRRGGGRPVAGAEVTVYANGQPRGEATTDASGAFRIEGLLPGPQHVGATAAGLLPADQTITVGDGDLSGIALELGEAAQVRGQVVDDRDAPCPGATISVEGDHKALRPVRAGDDGRFLLAELPPVDTALRATCGPRGRARLDLGKLAAGEQREVTLRLSAAGLFVRGTARWKDGRPAAGIEVTAGNLRADMGPEATATDPAGAYQLGPFPAGALLMVTARSTIATASEPANGSRTVRLNGPQDATGVDFSFARSEGTIRGVVAGPGGAPLAGAVVALLEGPAWTRMVTDPDGAFLLDGLAPGEHQIHAEYPGLLPEEVEVPAGRGDVKIRLRRGAVLAGVVEGGSGRGAGFCSVWARPAAGKADERAPPDRAVCGPGGAFELRGLPPGVHDLFASTIDGRSGGLPAVALSEGQERRGLRVRLAGDLTAVGSVVDLESRRPIPGARVRAMIEPAPVEVVTDGKGGFRIERVPRGVPVDLEVTAPGHLDNLQMRMAPVAGETLDYGILPLLAERPGPPPTGRAGLIITIGPDGRIAVSGTIDDLPAGQAGITKGDVLLAIDGHDLANVNLETAVALIRGNSGAPLTLQLRGADQKVRTVRIVRA